MISIIIPTFNSGSTILNALNSIVNQTYQSWEIIIVDGLSTDDTIDKIRTYSERDKRIRWMSEPDLGIYDAMNKGIALAQGEWLYFLGSDDELYNSEVLAEIFKEPISSDVGIICGRVKQRNLGVTDIQSTAREDVIFDNLNHQSIICRKSVLQNFPFEQKYTVYADQIQLIRMVAAGVKSVQKDVIIAHYSMDGYSSYQVDMAYSRDKKSILFQLFQNKLPSSLIYRTLKNQSFDQIKYDNPIRGLLWLYSGGFLKERWRDILYCFKVRFYRSILGSNKFK